jgi:hypothetical protein
LVLILRIVVPHLFGVGQVDVFGRTANVVANLTGRKIDQTLAGRS